MAPTLKLRKGLPFVMDADDNPTFDRWMERVDALVWKFGLSVHDLPDCDYWTWYDERLRPVRAANRALRRT